MAKVIAPFKLRGTIGDLVFYENEFGPQVKQKSSPTEWHIQHQKSFKNALRTGAEWKRATAGAKLLRAAMGSMVNGVKNMRLSGRMNAPLLQALQADPIHDWGERVISSGDPSVMVGFEFNHALALEDALPLNVKHCYRVGEDGISLQIPAFRLRQKKGLPKEATHYRLVSGLVTMDFDKRDYHRDIQESPLLAMGRKAGEAFSVEHVVAGTGQGSFWILGIEFYRMENNKPVLLRGGAMRVMEWIGPAGARLPVELTTIGHLRLDSNFKAGDLQPLHDKLKSNNKITMPHIRHELLIEAPASTIYDAITTQEGLAGWWTPDATAKPAIHTVARFPFGPAYFKEMKITELIPSRLVKWICIAGADEWIGTTLTFELQAGDKETLRHSHPEVTGQLQQLKGDQATLLIFHHDDWKDYTPMFAECNYTWGQFLRSLKLLCETCTGRPWPHQHRTAP